VGGRGEGRGKEDWIAINDLYAINVMGKRGGKKL